jgi:ADP-heptose:LPS heptosyltransferase
MGPDAFTPGLLARLPEPPGCVAIVCASRIGDFLCATPAFRALKRQLPGARFTLIGLPFVQELVERNPHLDDFAPFPGFPGMAEQFFNAALAVDFFREMQQRRFHLALQMHGSGVYSNIFTLMLGARCTAGFVREGDRAGRLEAAMVWPASVHAARRALALAVFVGAKHCGEDLEFYLFPEDHAAAASLIEGFPLPLIGLHPGSREADKQWPEERFASASRILRKVMGGTVLILGGPREGPAGERIASSIGDPACNLAGPRSLGVMGALISRLSVLVTNDSGPAHVAYALRVPSVTLFGKTDPGEWGPPSRSCHRFLRACDGKLDSIGVDEVVLAAASAAKPAA